MDPELVLRARNGDEQAFASLLDAVGGRLLATARAILREPDLAEDATQQALIGIWRDLPRLRDPARFEAWTYRVLMNACHTEARKTSRWRMAARGLDTQSANDALASVGDRDELERGFRQLSVDQRAAFVLHHHIGLTVGQVAEVLEVPVETVRSRIRSAARGMRAALEADRRGAAPSGTPEKVLR